MDTFVKEIKSADTLTKKTLLGSVRSKVSQSDIKAEQYGEIIDCIGAYLTNSDVNMRQNAISAMLVVLASLRNGGNPVDYLTVNILKAMKGLIEVFGLVGSENQWEISKRCLQVIYDLVPTSEASLLKILGSLLSTSPWRIQAALLDGILEASNRIGADFAVPIATSFTDLLYRLLDAPSGVIRDKSPTVLATLYRFHPEVRERSSHFKLRRDQVENLKKLFNEIDLDTSFQLAPTSEYQLSLNVKETLDASSSTTSNNSAPIITSIVSSVPAILIRNEDDLKREFSDIVVKLKATKTHEWEQKVALNKRFQAVILGGATKQPNFLDELKPFLERFKELLKESRAAIIDEVTRSIATLVEFAGETVSLFCERLMKELLAILFASNSVVADHGDTCIRSVLKKARPNSFNLICSEALNGSHIQTRVKCLLYIQIAIDDSTSEYIDKYRDIMDSTIKAAVADKDSSARANARRCFASFHKRWPSRGIKLFNSWDDTTKALLKKEGLAPTSDENEPSKTSKSLSSSTSSLTDPSSTTSANSNPLSLSCTVPTTTGMSASTSAKDLSVRAPVVASTAKRVEKSSNSASSLSSSRTAQHATGGATRVAKNEEQQHHSTTSHAPARVPATVVASSSNSNISTSTSVHGSVTKAQRVQRPTDAVSPTKDSKVQRKIVSSNNLISKPVPTSVTKSTSSSILNHSVASSSSVPSSKPVASSSSTSNVTYSASSTDSSEFRKYLKSSSLSNIEERSKAMEGLRNLIKNDSLPAVWNNAQLYGVLITTLGSKLTDSQIRVSQSALDILQFIAMEHRTLFESSIDSLVSPLFLVAFGATIREEIKLSAQSLLSILAENHSTKLIQAALKEIERPDPKMRLCCIRSLSFIISKNHSHFENQSNRIKSFIMSVTTKPNDWRSTPEMTRAVTELLSTLNQAIGEPFAVQLRLVKFTGQDDLFKKLKIDKVPSASQKSTQPAASQATVAKPKAIAKPSTSTVAAPSNQTTKPRPKLQRQMSLTLPTTHRSQQKLDEVNAEHLREFEALGLSSQQAPLTPNYRKALRDEISQTPNVLALVMDNPIVSPLTPSIRNGTPSFGARGRSTSTPQLLSKSKPLMFELENTNPNAVLSPIKFSLEEDNLSSLASSLKNNIQLQQPDWDSAGNQLKSLTSCIETSTTEQLANSLSKDNLLVVLGDYLDRGKVPTILRQSAAAIIVDLRGKLSASDWEPHFAQLADYHRRLILNRLEKAN